MWIEDEANVPDGNSTVPPPLSALALAMHRLMAPASLVVPLPAAPQSVRTLSTFPALLFTVSMVLAVAESVPLLPVTPSVEVPEVADVVEMVNVDVPEPPAGTEIDAGLKLADSPASRPVTGLKVTLPLKPFCEVAVTV
jgi:hypothetical protein